MKVVIDIEANGLENPDQIWLIVCKDIDNGRYEIFRRITSDHDERRRFLEFAKGVTKYIGHNIIGYDLLHLRKLVDEFDAISSGVDVIDTLVISRLVDYPRKKHSLKDYGEEFNLPKLDYKDFSKYSEKMVEYCIRDVDITYHVYKKYIRVINNSEWKEAINLEQQFEEQVITSLQNNGFAFNTEKATKLLSKVEDALGVLDKDILDAFPPREVPVREFTPKATKFGTISKTSVPRSLWERVSEYEIGQTYALTKTVEFNPSSHKQLIEVLTEAGWKPVNKTETHKDKERELAQLERAARRDHTLDAKVQECYASLERLKRSGWKIDETNLSTLPDDAPPSARMLAKRILLESRRRTLVEWLGLVREDGRIHGRFYGIGAWTHRMAHQKPNTANIPGEFELDGSTKLYGKEMRQLWCAPKKRLLVGVDAEGIQLRVFAHYIDDKDFTNAIVNGRKDDKTDPHSFNATILGSSRGAAKRFIFAYLLGAGVGKLSEILGVSKEEGEAALNRLIQRYAGLAFLKETVIPADAKRGWFIGFDGRKVRIPGDTKGSRSHLAMSGYLQNGEQLIMKRATLKWHPRLKDYDAFLVNLVHDEWQTETPNDFKIAMEVAQIQADSLREVGEELGLKCPLAGSYWNDDHKDYTIGNNWYQTH